MSHRMRAKMMGRQDWRKVVFKGFNGSKRNIWKYKYDIIIHPAHAEVMVRNDVPVVGGSLSLVQAA